jgi:Methyltransferase domain
VPDLQGPVPQRGDTRMRQRISRAHYATLGALFNASTFRHVDALGIQPGWRCWEVGAGGPTVPAWLGRRVEPGGHVLATDVDVAALREAAEPGFDVLRHDVAAEPVPAGGFDLVHARLVVMHLADRVRRSRR